VIKSQANGTGVAITSPVAMGDPVGIDPESNDCAAALVPTKRWSPLWSKNKWRGNLTAGGHTGLGFERAVFLVDLEPHDAVQSADRWLATGTWLRVVA